MLKPLDAEAVYQIAKTTGAVITLENHTTIGGLGSAVADALLEAGWSGRFKKIGIPDVFMECGSIPYLTDKHGLSLRHVVQAAKEILDN
ncbi:MAG: transketolase C-terminal domain-containing protein [Burkholderiales bacterium]